MPNQMMVDAARFGLAYERQRLQAASYNLAVANVALGASDSAPLHRVALQGTGFLGRLGTPVLTQEPAGPATVRTVPEPENPLADANGLVRVPNVDTTQEMATLVSASRAYEANVRAFNLLRQISAAALEIGGKR